MKNRVIFGALLMALMLICVFVSPVTRVLFFAAAGCLCAYEYSHQFEKRSVRCSMWVMFLYIIAQAALVLLNAVTFAFIACFIVAVYLALSSGILWKTVSGEGALATVAGLAYPCMLFSAIMAISVSRIWLETLAIACLATWSCDNGAFMGGTRFGKHKLAPSVSPNKTVEGALIGAMSAALVGVLVYLLGILFAKTSFPGSLYTPVPLWICVATSLAASTMGQIGDLAESLIKRMIGVKDYSNLIPGHGGMMDRADSLLFSIPTAFFCLILFGL